MIFRITEIDKVLSIALEVTHPLWVVKGGFFEGPVYETWLRITDYIDALSSVCINGNQTVITRV